MQYLRINKGFLHTLCHYCEAYNDPYFRDKETEALKGKVSRAVTFQALQGCLLPANLMTSSLRCWLWSHHGHTTGSLQ